MIKLKTYLISFALSALLLLSNGSANAQEDNTLPVYIKSDLTLEKGSYEIKGTHYVAKDVTLRIGPGATLLFDKDATIRIDGGLVIEGDPRNLSNITSKNPQNPGNGFVINSVSPNKDIIIKYARFNHLKKPLAFEFRWSRNTVIITSNVFKNSKYEGAAIQVREIDNLLTERKIYFTFKDNTFSNNTSSILISNITSDLLTVDFDNNVVTRNEYTGRTRNGLFTSPVYLTYNDYQANDVPTLDHNSVFDNFYSLFYEDTFNIGRTNLSIIGNADELNVDGNYFGDPKNGEIQKTFDFISANYQAPFLYASNTEATPPNYLNGHFYEIFMNGERLNEEIIFTKYAGDIKNIELRFNRPVEDGSNYGVFYHYVDKDDKIQSVKLKTGLKWSEGNQFVKININEKLKDYGLTGYLEVDGFYDSEGMDVPTLYIGKQTLIEPSLRNYVPDSIKSNLPKKSDVELKPGEEYVAIDPDKDIVYEINTLPDTIVHKKRDYWDLGFFAGNAIYFGDLNKTVLSVSPRKMTPALGFRGGYQFTENFKLKATTNLAIIRGSDRPLEIDDKNPRGTNYERNLSFRTTIVDLGVLAEYNLWKYRFKSTYVPSVFAGLNGYYFQPMAQVVTAANTSNDNNYYILRDIGTGGQTLPGGPGKYQKFAVGIPMGLSIKRHITQHLVAQASYTYNKLFTDYLDDVGTDFYPTSSQIEAANPNIQQGYPTALSNPGDQATTAKRSYSDDNDGYGFWGITLTWKLY